jgi:hypothetical protein
MREQEVRELYEAYLQVHQPQEEVEQLDEEAPERITKRTKNKRLMKDAGPARLHNPVKEETDLFDTILEHLVAEGYADTNENALVIMANMSEGWRKSIVESEEKKEEESQKPFTGEGPKKPKGWKPTGPKLKTGQRPGYAR